MITAYGSWKSWEFFPGWHGSDWDPTRILRPSYWDTDCWKLWPKPVADLAEIQPFETHAIHAILEISIGRTWIAWITSTWRLKTWGQKGQHAWIILNILIHNITMMMIGPIQNFQVGEVDGVAAAPLLARSAANRIMECSSAIGKCTKCVGFSIGKLDDDFYL